MRTDCLQIMARSYLENFGKKWWLSFKLRPHRSLPGLFFHFPVLALSNISRILEKGTFSEFSTQVYYFITCPPPLPPRPHPENHGMSNDNDIGDYGDYGDYDDGGHLMDHPGGPGLHVAPEVLHQLLLHEVAPVAPAHRQHSLRLLLVLGMVFSQLYSFGYMVIHQHIRELTDKSTHVFGKLCSSARLGLVHIWFG